MRLMGFGLVSLVAGSAMLLGIGGCGDNSSGAECGAGTMLVNGACVADPGLGCGAGTMEVDGECVANPLVCGADTFESNGECVSFDPDDATAPVTTATPAGGRMRELPAFIVLRSDEPAMIYFTVDGTDPTTSSPSEPSPVTIPTVTDGLVVKFFAVDGTGNEETFNTETYTLDVTGPAPVVGLMAARTDASVAVSWTNPTDADFAGAVIVRSANGAITGAPTDGQMLAAGDMLPSGETVLFVGNGTSTTDTLTTIGESVYYAAWAADDLGNYSPVRLSNTVVLPVPPQNGTLSVALATGVVTVMTPPANLTLSGTATYTAGTNTLTVDLTVQNDLSRLLFNLKGLTTSVNQGTQTGPTFAGSPMTYFGPEALESGASFTRTLTFTGIDGATDPILIDLSFVDHPMLYGSHELADSSGGGGVFSRNTTSGTGEKRQGAVSADGRFLYFGDKDDGNLFVTDTTTLEQVAAANLGGSSVGGVARSRADGQLYAVVNVGGHYHGGDGSDFSPSAGIVRFVALDATSLAEMGSVLLPAIVAGMAGRGVFISPDGDRAIIPVSMNGDVGIRNELWMVDLRTMTVVDTDAATAGVQPIVLAAPDGNVEHCAWSPSGATFFVGYNTVNIGRDSSGDGNIPAITAVNMTTYALTEMPVTDAGLASGGMMIRGGKLYYGSRTKGDGATNVFTIFDLATMIESNPDTGFSGSSGAVGVIADPTRARYYVVESKRANDEVAVFDMATDMRIDMDGDANNGVTNLNMRSSPHVLLISPF